MKTAVLAILGSLLLLGLLAMPAGLYETPAAAEPRFTGSLDFDFEVEHVLTVPHLWAQFGLTPEEAEGRAIVMIEELPDGGAVAQLRERHNSQPTSVENADGEQSFAVPGAGPVRTVYPDDDPAIDTVWVNLIFEPDGPPKKQRVIETSFEVSVDAIKPEAESGCEAIEIGDAAMFLSSTAPAQAIACRMRPQNGGEPVIVSIYAVRNGLFDGLYVSYACSAIHDDIAAREGARVAGLHHVCLSLRQNGWFATETPLELRYYGFAAS